MIVKPGDFNLQYWQYSYDYKVKIYTQHEVAPGIRVCSSSNRKYLGVVVNVGSKEELYGNRHYTLEVDIYWQTGPRKGTTQTAVQCHNLVNYDAYKKCIYNEIKELEKNEAEAVKTGM